MGNRSSRKKKQTYTHTKKGTTFKTDGRFIYVRNRSDSLSGGDYGFDEYKSRSERKTCGTLAKNAGNTTSYFDADFSHGKGGGDCGTGLGHKYCWQHFLSTIERVKHDNHDGSGDGEGSGGGGGGGSEAHGNHGVGVGGKSGADQNHVGGDVRGGAFVDLYGDDHSHVTSGGGGGGNQHSHVVVGGGGMDHCHVGGGDSGYGGGGGGHSADHSHVGGGDAGYGGGDNCPHIGSCGGCSGGGGGGGCGGGGCGDFG